MSRVRPVQALRGREGRELRAVTKLYFLNALQIQVLPFADYFFPRAHTLTKEQIAMSDASSQHPAMALPCSGMPHFGRHGANPATTPPVRPVVSQYARRNPLHLNGLRG